MNAAGAWQGGANNYPLKGGKMNNWEGGIRGAAFASGGWLPQSQRGIKYGGLIALWDWYATFAHLAGVDPTDHRAALAGLPPIDSYDLSGVLLGTNVSSPRTELPIGTEPRETNLSSAPLCSSYDDTPYYQDPRCARRNVAQTISNPPHPLPAPPPSCILTGNPPCLSSVWTATRSALRRALRARDARLSPA